jgi:hypothetical protein
VTSDYFDSRSACRQALFWASATRLQLDRFEHVFAEDVRAELRGDQSAGVLIWQVQMEYHLCIVAAGNMVQALSVLEPLLDDPLTVDQQLTEDLKNARDLHEHWDHSYPILLGREQLRHSGGDHRAVRRFLTRNPGRRPYPSFDFNSRDGAVLLPTVTATAVHQLLDEVEAEVLGRFPEMAEYRRPRSESPWVLRNGGIWPMSDPPRCEPQG